MTYLINKGDRVRLYTYDRTDHLEGTVVGVWRGRANVWFDSKIDGRPMTLVSGRASVAVGIPQRKLEVVVR